jgi:hypothetical protein
MQDRRVEPEAADHSSEGCRRRASSIVGFLQLLPASSWCPAEPMRKQDFWPAGLTGILSVEARIVNRRGARGQATAGPWDPINDNLGLESAI